MSAQDNNPWGTPPPTSESRGPFGGPWAESGSDEGFGPTGDGGTAPGAHQCVELCPICRGAEILRASGGTGELRGQLDDVGREALLTLRALVDHYLERLDARPAGRGEVEEIPID
jgi:hypothetical protein